MQERLDVVFTIDENYIQHFCVACTSLLENNQNIGRIFLVQDIDESNSKLLKTIDFLKAKYSVEIKKLALDSKILENFTITHHISKATYFRLLLPEILPSDVDKVLFLDSDIVVLDDLSNLIELDFGDAEYYIYGVNHKYNEIDLKRLRKIDFEGNSYFNAGIMYINLKKWRKDNISKLLIENATKYNEHLLWWDQDVLNITFDKEWGELDYTHNAFGLTDKDDSQDYKIIHYTGSSKPWHFRNNHPYKNLYWKYLRMTPFKRYIPEDLTIFNVLKWMVPVKVKEILKGFKNEHN